MSRDRIPRGEILQAAYGVLDKYKMNRSFFVKTEQTNCETLAPPVEAVDQIIDQVVEVKAESSENETDSDEISIEDSLEDELTTVSAWGGISLAQF